VVVGGNTLYGLAAYYGTNLNAILALNPQITNPRLIINGHTIKIPDFYN
jgi:LysM repeat protein